jgi:hypothetical protein
MPTPNKENVQRMMREFQKLYRRRTKNLWFAWPQEDGEKKAEDEPRNDEK